MKLSKPTCPECGQPAIGTCDTIPGCALFMTAAGGDPDGNPDVEYGGETKVYWDGQMTDKVDGLPQVQCHAGHQWGTEIEVG